MSDTAALLFANEAFYVAFASGDIEAMEDLWSKTADITCIHPGWPALEGRDEVIQSWRAILGTDTPLIRFSNAIARVHGDLGYVICHEHLEPGDLVATNIFVREGRQWRLIHHQAGISPAAGEGSEQADEKPDRMQ